MKPLKSYECSFCGELYHKKEDCESHEKICDFRPRIKSCGSCAYLWLENVEFEPYQETRFHTCLVNQNISNSNYKKECPYYLNIKHRLDIAKMNRAINTYDIMTPLRELESNLCIEKDK